MYNGKPLFGIAIPCIAENPQIAKRILYSMLYLTNKTFITLHYETKKRRKAIIVSVWRTIIIIINFYNQC